MVSRIANHFGGTVCIDVEEAVRYLTLCILLASDDADASSGVSANPVN